MPNASVLAAAEGLPEINRRRLLLGLAAASTAAATATVATAATPAENPELVRLGDMLPSVEAEYVRVRHHQDETKRKWAPQWPVAPADLTSTEKCVGVSERDFAGAHWGRKIYSTSDLGWRVSRARSALRSKATKNPWHFYWSREEWQAELEEAQRLYDLAAAYEAETARITDAAKYTEAWQATKAAAEVLARHVTATMKEPDHTMTGLLIKAEALAAWGRINDRDKIWGLFEDSQQWHGHIAASILRHASGGAS